VVIRRRGSAAASPHAAPLTVAEEARVAELLREDDAA
jgi:hypothetical protein